MHHTPSDRLVPDSNSLADAAGFEIFDQFVYDPVTAPTYDAAQVDLGFDADNVRVWADISAALGPGESGQADPIFQVD